MQLTGTDIDKVYTEQLTRLLLNGYTIVVARENGSLEQDKGKYNRTLLEKGGNRFEFGFWCVEINSNTEKQILGLMKAGSFKSKYRCIEEEKLLTKFFTCYSYVFEMGGITILISILSFRQKKKLLNYAKSGNNVRNIVIGCATVLSILSRWLKQTILASKKILQLYLCQRLIYSLIKMVVKQFFIKAQDAYQLIKKTQKPSYNRLF